MSLRFFIPLIFIAGCGLVDVDLVVPQAPTPIPTSTATPTPSPTPGPGVYRCLKQNANGITYDFVDCSEVCGP